MQGGIEDFNASVRLNPDSGMTYLSRGEAFQTLRETQKALADFKEASRIFQKQGNISSYTEVQELITRMENPEIKNSLSASSFAAAQQISVDIMALSLWKAKFHSVGSGVLIKREGKIYTVLTVYHILDKLVSGYVMGYDQKIYTLEKIRRLGQWDLAIGEFQSTDNYKVAEIGDSNRLQIGTPIYVSGFSEDHRFIFAGGQFVEKSSNFDKYGNQIFYDNKTLTGMSGGAILNDKGELVGIHTSISLDQRLSIGIPSALFGKLLK